MNKAVEGIDENAVENVQYVTDVDRLTAKVRSPIGSVRSFSKSVAQDPTRPMSMPLSLAKLPLCEVVSGSFSSVIVTSSVGLEPCKEKEAIMKELSWRLRFTYILHVCISKKSTIIIEPIEKLYDMMLEETLTKTTEKKQE